MKHSLKKRMAKLRHRLSSARVDEFSIVTPHVRFASGLGNGGWLLHGLVHGLKPSVCVEIGSARGLSACYIGMALKQLGKGKLYAIDPHEKTEWNDDESRDTFDVIQSNLKKFTVEKHVEVLRGYSHDIGSSWDRPIDLLFIDGDHSYEGVKRDWDLFVPHVKPFGVVVFHDTIWDLEPESEWSRDDMGVPRFVDELRASEYPVITLSENCGISMVQPTRKGMKLTR